MTETRKAYRSAVKYKNETVRLIKLIRQQYGTIRRFCIIHNLDESTFRNKLLKLKRHRGIYVNQATPTPEKELETIYKLLNTTRW